MVCHSPDSNALFPASTLCFFWLTASIPGSHFPIANSLSRVSEDVSTLGQKPKGRAPVTLAMTLPSFHRMGNRYFRFYSSVSISLSQKIDILIQSYLSTCWLQNSSNCVLIWTRKKCFCTRCLLTTRHPSLTVKQRALHQSHGRWLANHSVLIGFSACHEFQNELTMSYCCVCTCLCVYIHRGTHIHTYISYRGTQTWVLSHLLALWLLTSDIAKHQFVHL